MNKVSKRIICIILTFTITFATLSSAYANETFAFDSEINQTIEIVEDSDQYQIIEFADADNQQYTMYVDKVNGIIEIELYDENSHTQLHYLIKPTVLETGEQGIEITYPDGEIETYAAAFAIPLWMGLSTVAVEALIALGKALIATVVTSGAFVLAEELYNTMKKSSTLYYEAYVDINNHLVFVGDELERGQATGIIATNSKKKAVFCKTRTVAQNLASRMGGVKSEHNADCIEPGQWPHFHCKDFPNAHIFYLN